MKNNISNLIINTPQGIYIPAGDFFIDPKKKVNIAVITHAHSDHAIPGHKHYVATKETALLLKARISKKIKVSAFDYYKKFRIKDVSLFFVPAGHILGSAQVVIEINKTRIVVSGDYKREEDKTTKPFEPIPADVFITETTFAHPTYIWNNTQKEYEKIQQWWDECQKLNLTAVLKVYSLGKAQRILHYLQPTSVILVHKSIYKINKVYKHFGVKLPTTFSFSDITKVDKNILRKALLLVPHNSKVIQKLPLFSYQIAEASGHFANPNKLKPHLHKHFIISDHADFNSIIKTIEEVSPKKLILTHGNIHFLKNSRRYVSTQEIEVF